jgi:hypothetical protein
VYRWYLKQWFKSGRVDRFKDCALRYSILFRDLGDDKEVEKIAFMNEFIFLSSAFPCLSF